ncbi:hypothetical protein [Tenacibaculum aestuarii]|uniref:hypothetical protein n=1 Tax=Tenacibaculum aestuarii TaxID=362781 RepID=UPI0038958523
MTTVQKLIEELEKMPKGLFVSLNIDKNGSFLSIPLTEIKVEEKALESPYSEPGTKQKFIILTQKGF